MHGADGRLRWIEKNRRSPREPELVGSVARAVLAEGARLGTERHRKVLSTLAEHAGPALMEWVCAVGLHRGVLRLEVSDPAALYHLRLQWEQPLLEILRAELPACGIHTVRFTVRGHKH